MLFNLHKMVCRFFFFYISHYISDLGKLGFRGSGCILHRTLHAGMLCQLTIQNIVPNVKVTNMRRSNSEILLRIKNSE